MSLSLNIPILVAFQYTLELSSIWRLQARVCTCTAWVLVRLNMLMIFVLLATYDAIHVQGNYIKAFCAANCLTLNTSKTEAIKFSVSLFCVDTIHVAYTTTDTQFHDKCLDVWWRHDLSPCRLVENNVLK